MEAMKRYLFACILLLCAWTVPVQAVSAKLSFTTALTLPTEGEVVEVKHTIQVDTLGDTKLELPVRDVKEVRLRQGDQIQNAQLEETEELYFGQTLKTTTFSFTPENKANLTLSYETSDPLMIYGKNSALMWSSFAGGGTQRRVSVEIPGRFGRPSILGVSSSDSSFESGTQTFQFDMGKAGKPVKLLFGSSAIWQLDWSTTLKNSSWWWQKHYVVLPPDTNQQRAWLESVSPEPNRLSVDRDGNLVAEFRIWPKKSLSVTAASYVDARALFYNTSNTRPLSDVPDNLQDYTTRIGNRLAKDTHVLGQVKKFYEQAVEAAREREGNPQRLASDGQKIVVELLESLRRSGVPTREVQGVALAGNQQLLEPFKHTSWVEAYVPGIGWMTIDPLDEQYGFADALHIGLVIFGVPSDVPLSTRTDGLSIKTYSKSALPNPDFGATEVKLTRFVLVPGLSLNRSQVLMPKGAVLDNTASVADNTTIIFGSLAPLQRASRWSASIGGTSLRGGEIQFGKGGEVGLGELLAKGSIQRNYLPMVAEILVLGLGGWWLIRSRRRRNRVGKVSPLEKQPRDATIAADDLLRTPKNMHHPRD